MFDIQNYPGFIVAIIVFQIIPGPGTITILNASARNGIGSGMKAVFGTLSGDFIYMLAAVLGLAAVLSAYPSMLSIAQWLGTAYLCWMGLKLLLTKVTEVPGGIVKKEAEWVVFRQAFAISLTNPKVIIFFMAFFPLFLSRASSPMTLIFLMVHVTVISLAYQTFLVFVGNSIARRLSQWRYIRIAASRLAGIGFIGFAIKLAYNNR
jgi:threonine/homoserine/homoserine lactone efflux protein